MVTESDPIKYIPFQDEVVHKLLGFVENPFSKPTIVVKSPTGSGKTVILIQFIDEYLKRYPDQTAFIWLCPGKGNLEEQSRNKMRQMMPDLKTQLLFDALAHGFDRNTTSFINWELITKTGNKAISDTERNNLFEWIAKAQREGTHFIVIIDEEHSNNTKKAQSIISAFAADHIIRMSATASEKSDSEFLPIDEDEVIDAHLITKAIYVNEGVDDNIEITNEYDYLLELADEKRKAIAARYQELGKNIRPLVLIQFPNGEPENIAAVEQKLASMGYTYSNGMVSKWMSEDKEDLPENLTENDGQPVFLLMKQAISTGWDCPRAKILVKLRENTEPTFAIQTIGRIRRMPERVHYNDSLLDFCYVYTFDKDYTAGIFANENRAYEVRRLFLKDKCKDFVLKKELRNLENDGLGDREVFIKVHDALVEKYHLNGDMNQNKNILKEHDYRFEEDIIGRALSGEYVHTDMLMESKDYLQTRQKVNTSKNGRMFLHSIDAIKTSADMTTSSVRSVLERLFRKTASSGYKLLNLSTNEFYAFVINNERLLRHEFIEVTAKMCKQGSFVINPKTAVFRIPEHDLLKYDPKVKNETEYPSNAYIGYTSGFATSSIRSNSESLFEIYCNSLDDLEWVYKNGDSGQQYFSVVYVNALLKQRLFYPDYIAKKKDGSIWIIETKGGESHGQDKNIDPQIENKFNALKRYADAYKVNWGFVRDKDNQLYIDNTEYAESLADKHWVPLTDEF